MFFEVLFNYCVAAKAKRKLWLEINKWKFYWLYYDHEEDCKCWSWLQEVDLTCIKYWWHDSNKNKMFSFFISSLETKWVSSSTFWITERLLQ